MKSTRRQCFLTFLLVPLEKKKREIKRKVIVLKGLKCENAILSELEFNQLSLRHCVSLQAA